VKVDDEERVVQLAFMHEMVDFCLDAWSQMIQINHDGRTEDLDPIKDVKQLEIENVSTHLQRGFHGVVKNAFDNKLISIDDFLKKSGVYDKFVEKVQ